MLLEEKLCIQLLQYSGRDFILWKILKLNKNMYSILKFNNDLSFFSPIAALLFADFFFSAFAFSFW